MGFYENELTEVTPDELYRQFVHGSGDSGADALLRLIETGAETHLLAALHSPRGMVIESAAMGLLECWVSEEGLSAREQLQEAIEAMDGFDYRRAESILQRLILTYGDWAEPLHQLATLRYIEGDHAESVRLHRLALRHKPHHFRAWHGLALNAVEMRDWTLARDASLSVLAIRPNCRSSHQILVRAEQALAA